MVDQNFDPAVHSLDPNDRPPPQPLPLSAPVPQQPAAQPEPAQEEGRYRYVLRPVQAAYHIYEEMTGKRITTLPIVGEHQAQEAVQVYNERQVAPS